ncbi:MAG: DEAD/DEAH box helicase, partial [Comamonadaceae bacterium]
MTDHRWVGLPDLLSRLEDLELHLLSWGVVDGHLSRTDVDGAIDDQLNADVARDPSLVVPSPEEYLGHLVQAGLLHEIPGEDRYRTRLAETLRLLRTLRQLLPPTDESKPGWWRHSSTLVSDYRLRVSPRRYPARRIAVDEVIEALIKGRTGTEVRENVIRRMVGTDKLAQFQVDATRSILESLADPQPAATIITAGTGSGKTRAFYLPALIDIAVTISERRTGPHTLALYPRNELLRDQARESVRVIESIGPLAGVGSRPGRIGMLYGNTPTEKELDRTRDVKRWRRVASGWETPYFPCLDDDCLSVLVWTDADRAAHMERLTCPKCGAVTQAGVVAMTRESIKNRPPDILFSSTEMLSKQATSWQFAPLLGWKGSSGTRLVLLDEVHTYTGVSGAQVALMLRRWRNADRQHGRPSPVFVGLSATLRDAGDFMATLTGVDRAHVETIAPAAVDMLPTSREYGIVLRGDPVSGASLPSTTIQTAMLLSRMLDNQPGIYGSVAFTFTDDLDVINRLYDNLRDAEGHDLYGIGRGRVLADLRSPANDQASARYPEGQSWDLPNKLGRMDRKMRVARTSSQDTGVDTGADIIVATSSLEVGFNDPRVGVVIQHKAPRDMASFLQRRGRAGRKLAMRPVTAVVLSDYGRDRITYQAYERLLDPEISARSLPIGNRFVLKIQGTHALLDWIFRKTNADARWVMQAPLKGALNNRTAEVAGLLARLVDSAEAQRDLALHLRRALQITEDEANAVLWEEPRSLMLSVVPTALRRL